MNPKSPPVINYEAMIIPNSWWKDIRGRIWVIVSRQCTPVHRGEGIEFIPSTVKLLEQYKSDLIEQPWDYVIELIETGKFTPLRPS